MAYVAQKWVIPPWAPRLRPMANCCPGSWRLPPGACILTISFAFLPALSIVSPWEWETLPPLRSSPGACSSWLPAAAPSVRIARCGETSPTATAPWSPWIRSRLQTNGACCLPIPPHHALGPSMRQPLRAAGCSSWVDRPQTGYLTMYRCSMQRSGYG